MSYRIHRLIMTGASVLVFLCLLVCACTVPDVLPVRADDTILPDLFIEGVTSGPVLPAIGTTMTFTVVVANRGEVDSGSCSLTIKIGDNTVHTTTIDPLPADSSSEFTFSWKAEPGEHVLMGTVDPGNLITESSETNNITSYAFSVLAPDLMIKNITWEPETVSAGDLVTFIVSVENKGNLASRYCALNFFIDDMSRGTKDIPALQPAETVNCTFSWSAQPGHVALRAVVDFWNGCKESYETNNELQTVFSPARPDLCIESIHWIPENRIDTDNVTMSVIVKNQGPGDSRGAWLSLSVDGLLVDHKYVSPLVSDGSRLFSYNWHPDSGEHTFLATIDSEDNVLESDETNNDRTAVIPPVGAIELSLENVSWTPLQPLVGHMVTFTALIKNTGAKTANNVMVRFYSSYGYQFKHTINSLAPGETANVDFNLRALNRQLNINIMVDEQNFFEEADESNNTFRTTLTPVLPAPTADLQVVAMSVAPASPEVGNTVAISAVVKNNGPSGVSESHLEFRLDGEIISSVPVTKLAAGATTTVNCEFLAEPGSHTISASADYNDYIPETNEENNENSITITSRSADLTVKSLYWAPAEPDIGDTVTIVAIIENQGDALSQETSLEYFINGESHGSHYINAIEPGDSIVRTFTWQAHVVPESFGAKIDGSGSVPEGNEDNNEKLAPLPAPDLAIDNIVPVPETIEDGMPVNFTVTVTNNGGGEAPDTCITALLDGDPLTSIDRTSIGANEQHEYTFFWMAELGNHRIEVTADEADRLVESNETNNASSFMFTVTERTIPVPDTTASESGSSGSNEEEPSESDSPEGDSTVNPELIDYLNEQLASQQQGSLPDVSESQNWWDIFTNLWFIIGIAVFGVLSIGALLYVRTRSNSAADTEAEPEAVPEPDPFS